MENSLWKIWLTWYILGYFAPNARSASWFPCMNFPCMCKSYPWRQQVHFNFFLKRTFRSSSFRYCKSGQAIRDLVGMSTDDIFITVITILWKSESPLVTAILFWKLKRLFVIKKVNTARIQYIFKRSAFLDNILGIVFINELW